MKKTLFYVAALMAALTSCQKEDAATESKVGVPMTLTLSIGDPATKTTYVESEGGLKVEWAAGDQVSVVSYDKNEYNGVAKTCDTFTATSAGNTTTFTGTYTGAADAPLINVIYPALTISTDELWGTPLLSGRYTGGRVFDINKTSYYGHTCFSYMNQPTDADVSNLKYYDCMSGAATLVGSDLSATLQKNIYVYKVVINTSAIPAGTVINSVILKTENYNSFGTGSWCYSTIPFTSGGSIQNKIAMFLGTNRSGTTFTGITKEAGDDELVVYIPSLRIGDSTKSFTLPSGNKFKVSVVDGSNKYYSKEITLTKDFTVEVGKMSTITATVVAE